MTMTIISINTLIFIFLANSVGFRPVDHYFLPLYGVIPADPEYRILDIGSQVSDIRIYIERSPSRIGAELPCRVSSLASCRGIAVLLGLIGKVPRSWDRVN